jgi:hypothetical protein
MKALFQEADRLHPERITALFAEVLAKDVRSQFGDAVLKELAGEIASLPGVGLPVGRAPAALLSDLDARIRALEVNAASDPSARRREAELTIREYAERWGRELNTHLSADGVREGRQIMSAYGNALQAACAKALSGLLSEAKAAPADHKMDLEENLLPKKRIGN